MIEYHKNFSLESLPYINLEGLICWEEFKNIPNYEGLYQVSDLGRIKSFKLGKESILKSNLTRFGYLLTTLFKNNDRKTKPVHQLVAITFLNHTPWESSLVVNHKNFIRYDNRLENLEIVTQRENSNRKHLKSSSEYTGVDWNNSLGKWRSRITINGKEISLGAFEDELEASKYYENALIAIKNGEEIQVKRRKVTSKYKGVSWSVKDKVWVASIWLDGKTKRIGSFKEELEAHYAFENYKKQITE